MRKIFSIILILSFIFVGLGAALAQEEAVEIHFFKSDTCPYCKKMAVLLDEYKAEFPELVVHEYDIVHESEGVKLLAKMAKEHDIKVSGVPVIFIKDDAIQGYDPDKFHEIMGKYYQRENSDTNSNQASGDSEYGYVGWIIIIGIVVAFIIAIVLVFRKSKPKNQ